MNIERLARKICQQGDQIIQRFSDNEFMDNYVLRLFNHFGLTLNFFHKQENNFKDTHEHKNI
jgi:hypothetical protein